MIMYSLILSALTLSTVFASESKTCGPYPYVTVEHGNLSRTGYMRYTFTCDKGYASLLKDQTVKCHGGKWKPSKEPKCYRIAGQCKDPPVVAHSKIYGDDRDTGSSVKYMCNAGYKLLGHEQLSCTQSGHWDKIPPTCMDETEPIQKVAKRLKNGFVTNIANYSADTPEGRALDAKSLRLGLELYIIIDRSSSVDPIQLEQAKTFVKYLLKRFAVRNGEDNERGTRASVITFGDDVQIVFAVNNRSISNHRLAAMAVDSIQPNGGGTNLERALTQVFLDVNDKVLRHDAKRALFLMTDGEPNINNPDITPQDIATSLKRDHGFEIFAVGIGQDISFSLLNELASQPPLSHVFKLEDYKNFSPIIDIIEKNETKPKVCNKDQCGCNVTGENQPWIVVIYIGGSPYRVCGGVLICDEWVLTAASCVQEGHDHINMKDVFVVFGERNLLLKDEDQTNFYVVDIRIHPRYDPEQRVKNDLALLKIYLPEDKNRTSRPACLPPTDRAVPMHLNLEINAYIAGWGRTSASAINWAKADDLHFFQMLTTPVALSEEDECPIHRHGLTPLCAGQGARACYGLLGSPLMAIDSSTGFHHILGILAHRIKCAEGQNQYVELTRYVQWINHETKECHLKNWGSAM